MFALFWERPQTPVGIDLLSISAVFCVDYAAVQKLAALVAGLHWNPSVTGR